MKHFTRPPVHHRQQSGVVLIVALVMLVIIGLASAAIMRNALTGDTVSDNIRRQAHALQAAQAALRYCEGEVQRAPAANALPAPAAGVDAEDWRTFSNWLKQFPTEGAPKVVPAAFLTAGDTNRNIPKKLPQCMAQFRTLGSGQVIVVTARGFSENYEADTSGRTQAGAVVWLQSIIQLES